jgi:hypothetical protein
VFPGQPVQLAGKRDVLGDGGDQARAPGLAQPSQTFSARNPREFCGPYS